MAELFEKLPFTEAIDALRERLAIFKGDFLRLETANRSRAFTMARISDIGLLETIHDELTTAITNGETYRDFEIRLDDLRKRSGWTGTSPWHYRLVYDTNMSMAYSAGRVQQGQRSGLAAWRYLPSLSDEPRVEHEAYYNKVFRMTPGTPVPPIDFNCNCGWEWVFPEELEAEGVALSDLEEFAPPRPASGFVWSATDYFDVSRAISGHDQMHRTGATRLVSAAALDAAARAVQGWFEPAVEAASIIARDKFERVMNWIADLAAGMEDDASTLRAIRDRIDDLPASDDREAELNHQATFAAFLAGMAKEMR